ncbi:uncharacterized protein [Leptinotarsa decemlineata]|uniref:uncharacterized protein n=1 Tax=Leptinotarsa decemlineata TaxID=7539 RepID=UPI003D303E89
MASISEFDKETENPCGTIKKSFWFSLVLLSFTTIFSPALNVWTWSKTQSYSKNYYVKFLQYPQHSAMIFLWFWIVFEIYRRFKFLNHLLLEIVYAKKQTIKTTPRSFEVGITPTKVTTSQKLKTISTHYDYLCDLVDEVNKLFGGILLFHVLFAKACIIYKMSVLIHLTILNATVDGVPYNGDARFSFSFVTLDVLFIIIFLLEELKITKIRKYINLFQFSVFAMATIGHLLSKEAQHTITICHRIIDESDIENHLGTIALKKNLAHFIQKIANRKPTISAVGFFVVDLNMVGFIISSITSYMIVAVQFLKDH